MDTLSRSKEKKKKNPKEAKHKFLKKIWYIVTAILFFILVIVAIVAASCTLTFFKNNLNCQVYNYQLTKNANIAAIIIASFCLISVVGFAILQVRRRRLVRLQKKAGRKEKRTKETEEETTDEEEEDEEEEEGEEKKKYLEEYEKEISANVKQEKTSLLNDTQKMELQQKKDDPNKNKNNEAEHTPSLQKFLDSLKIPDL